jgi:hypothetical protein
MSDTATDDRWSVLSDDEATVTNGDPKAMCGQCTLRVGDYLIKDLDLVLCTHCYDRWAPALRGLASIDLDGQAREKRILLELEKTEIREEANRRLAAKEAEGKPRPQAVDLTPYLEGAYEPIKPDTGGIRSDGLRLLYSGKWHTLVAPNTAGKSWLALWHTVAVLNAGGVVMYVHFEEATPASTIGRLRQLGVSVEVIDEQFVWINREGRFDDGAMSELVELHGPDLLVLDGILAACGQYGWEVENNTGVGEYRRALVEPATVEGIAVLSLGHPVKATARKYERHPLGATGWLDMVDGAGFRMFPSKTPIGKGRRGSSAIYTVKDRESEIERHGQLQTGEKEGWTYIGQMHMNDALTVTGAGNDDDELAFIAAGATTSLKVTAPRPEDQERERIASDPVAEMAAAIHAHLRATGASYDSERQVKSDMRAKGVTVTDSKWADALSLLVSQGRLDRWKVGSSYHGRAVSTTEDDQRQPNA